MKKTSEIYPGSTASFSESRNLAEILALTWIACSDKLPEDGDRILAFLPNNRVYLPGKTGSWRYEPVIFLRFSKNFFKETNPKHAQFGAHFWLGEGQSNHYFGDVTHWMPCPTGPNGEKERITEMG